MIRPSRETIGERSRTHGMFGTRFYFRYFSMVQRCNDVKSTSYSRYGGKGIMNLWNSFEDFRDDMYESYLKHVEEYGERETTLDRIDSSGNYCKENCRWATYKEQNRNKSDSHKITFNGKTLSPIEWAEELGMNKQTILSRLMRGWSDEDALTKPVKKYV